MKKMYIKLLLLSSILLCVSIDARFGRSSNSEENERGGGRFGKYKRSGAVTTGSGRGTVKSGGTFSTATSGGRFGASRNASTSAGAGHSAAILGARGGSTSSSFTGRGTGSHTATTANGKTATVTNKQIGLKNKIQGNSNEESGGRHHRPLFPHNNSSSSNSINSLTEPSSSGPKLGKFAAMLKKKMPGGESSESGGVSAKTIGVMSAMSDESDSSGSSSSDSSTDSTQKDQDNLFNADVAYVEGTPQVSSNTTKKPSDSSSESDSSSSDSSGSSSN